MKFEGINKLFTGAVASYLSDGYTINTGTMGGSSGEIAKVDLTDGKEVIRVILRRGYEHRKSEYVELVVGRWRTKDNNFLQRNVNVQSPRATIWDDSLEVIHRFVFWKIPHCSWAESNWYITEDEVLQARDKQIERAKRGAFCDSLIHPYTDDGVKRIVLPFVRRQPRCKRAGLADINWVAKRVIHNDDGSTLSEYVVSVKDGYQFILS